MPRGREHFGKYNFQVASPDGFVLPVVLRWVLANTVPCIRSGEGVAPVGHVRRRDRLEINKIFL